MSQVQETQYCASQTSSNQLLWVDMHLPPLLQWLNLGSALSIFGINGSPRKSHRLFSFGKIFKSGWTQLSLSTGQLTFWRERGGWSPCQVWSRVQTNIYIYAQLVPQWPIDAFVWPWAMFDMTLTETLRQHVHHLLCSIAMFGGSSFLASCNQLFNMIYYDVYVYV